MGSQDSDSNESEVLPRALPSRSTRGKRMGKLLAKEEEEADAQFWEQDAWKEFDEDLDDEILPDEYSTDERVDSEDSDISQSESEEEKDEEEQLRQEMKRSRAQRSKQGGVYKDPARRKGNRATAVKNLNVDGRSVRQRTKAKPVPLADRSLRTSTKRKASIAAGNRKAEEMRKKRKSANRKKSSVVEVPKLTQRELLEEAAKTEFENRRSLQVMLMIQAEKKRQLVAKSKPKGPRVQITSRVDAPTILTFTGVDSIPSEINCAPIPYPKKPVCVVTGLPAKYRDPKSGVPYATLQAFKAIRNGLASKASPTTAVSRTSNKVDKKTVPIRNVNKTSGTIGNESTSPSAKAVSAAAVSKSGTKEQGSSDPTKTTSTLAPPVATTTGSGNTSENLPK